MDFFLGGDWLSLAPAWSSVLIANNWPSRRCGIFIHSCRLTCCCQYHPPPPLWIKTLCIIFFRLWLWGIECTWYDVSPQEPGSHFNSLTAIGGHDRQLFDKLLWWLVTSTIFFSVVSVWLLESKLSSSAFILVLVLVFLRSLLLRWAE